MPAGDHRTELLAVEDLSAGYGAKPIVQNVSLSLRGGEITAVVGPNGAGKSTLLKAIMGLAERMGGSIMLDGQEVGSRRTDELARLGVGYVPQVRDVFGTLSVEENLQMGGYQVKRTELRARVDEVAEVFPALAQRRSQRADTLSGGERKMLAIARVLMLRPRVVLLDEPTAGLAPGIAQQVLSTHVRRLAEVGVATLVVEQRALEALAIADHAFVMVGGRVHASGPAAELAARTDIGEMFLGRRQDPLAGTSAG